MLTQLIDLLSVLNVLKISKGKPKISVIAIHKKKGSDFLLNNTLILRSLFASLCKTVSELCVKKKKKRKKSR